MLRSQRSRSVNANCVRWERWVRRATSLGGVSRSEYSQRNDHDARRVGSRHARVRDVSYDEATQRLEETFASDGATYYVVTARQAVQGDFVSCNEL